MKYIAIGTLLVLLTRTTVALPSPDTSDSDDDWVPANVIKVEKRVNSPAAPNLPSGADDWVQAQVLEVNKRDDGPKTAYSGLFTCLKQAQPDWPHTQVTKAQSDQCIKQNHAKRDDALFPREGVDAPHAIQDGSDTLATVCSTANIVLSNFLTDGDLAKGDEATSFATQVCEQTIGVVKDKGLPWGASFLVQAGHKKGLSIVHKGRQLRLLTMVLTNAFDMAVPGSKDKLMSMCKKTLVDLAKTCTTDLHYGAFEHQIDHVAKALTGYWRNRDNDVLEALFDFSMEMP